jgi:hypothetical protein
MILGREEKFEERNNSHLSSPHLFIVFDDFFAVPLSGGRALPAAMPGLLRW